MDRTDRPPDRISEPGPINGRSVHFRVSSSAVLKPESDLIYIYFDDNQSVDQLIRLCQVIRFGDAAKSPNAPGIIHGRIVKITTR